MVSVTLASESLGKFAPAQPGAKAASRKVWLLAGLFLLLLAAALAGLWYFSGR